MMGHGSRSFSYKLPVRGDEPVQTLARLPDLTISSLCAGMSRSPSPSRIIAMYKLPVREDEPDRLVVDSHYTKISSLCARMSQADTPVVPNPEQ